MLLRERNGRKQFRRHPPAFDELVDPWGGSCQGDPADHTHPIASATHRVRSPWVHAVTTLLMLQLPSFIVDRNPASLIALISAFASDC